MNNYTDFEVRDWLEDKPFQRWVYHGEDDEFWQEFMRQNPFQRANAEQAREILLALRGDLDVLPESEIRARVSEILDAIPGPDQHRQISWWNGNWLRVAALLVLAAGLAIGFFKKKDFKSVAQLARQEFFTAEKPAITKVWNQSRAFRLVNLPDGSSVVLKRNARISFPRQFDPAKREVSMSGEAFFEIVKNTAQPFFVYAGAMVTKVKGTSFSIRANEGEDQVDLVVKTGIVEVSAAEPDMDQPKKKLTLVPNEQVTFNRKNQEMKTKSLPNPVLLDLPVEKQNFEFKRTPLAEVFTEMKNTYGVDIRFDKNVISHCTITARLGDEPISEKLDMICAVVNAKYETRNGVITIVSGGCE